MASNITLPEGTTNHGNPNLLCTPAQWYDVLLFFLTNYLAHAGTVVTGPGRSVDASIIYTLYAIIFPSTALTRAVVTIVSRASFETKNPLKRAARAGALCMVLRRPLDEKQREKAAKRNTKPCPRWWEPQVQPKPIPINAKVYGEYWLHKDYCLVAVPPTASLSLASDSRCKHKSWPSGEGLGGKATLASSQNFLKLSISLAQAIWAIITIYRSRGDQIDQYGYAAFGLTVVPYAMMSIMNALAGLTTPDYPCLFVIRTPEMKTAASDEKAFFEGAISVDVEESPPAESRISRLLDEAAYYWWLTGNDNPLCFLISLGLSLAPIAIIGGLTGFRKGNSSQMERGFTMSWLIVGIVIGHWFHKYIEPEASMERISDKALFDRIFSVIFEFVFLYILFGAPAIGGMVMVGKMIREYGICTLFD